VPEYLVEIYMPRGDASGAPDEGARVRAAALRAGRHRARVRYRSSIFVPEDETCFILFEADSADAVREAARLVHLPCDRVSAAFSHRR
jgi:hypothetical protein